MNKSCWYGKKDQNNQPKEEFGFILQNNTLLILSQHLPFHFAIRPVKKVRQQKDRYYMRDGTRCFYDQNTEQWFIYDE